MNYPAAIVIVAALIAGAIATTGARSADPEPAFRLISGSGKPSAHAWRIDMNTGVVSFCAIKSATEGTCSPLKDL